MRTGLIISLRSYKCAVVCVLSVHLFVLGRAEKPKSNEVAHLNNKIMIRKTLVFVKSRA
jgi:hypothetical protein